MGYVLKAVLSSAQHPEYGQITVPFPIPDEKYDRMIELLEPLEIGDALRQDCRVDELDSFYTVLNRLVGSLVNFDELDYLAKRLDSFDDGEAAQFQGMACKLGVSNIKDFINLTFCCQQATVITDFSDLDAIGRQHYMTMQGGGCRIEELERLDGRKFALDLILNHLEGRITPYGVVYDTQGKSYRGNIEGSDPRCSFHWVGTSDRLYVFEAPIDLLAFLTLYPDGWQQHSYVALCGTAEHAMLWMLEKNPNLRKTILCLDHDAAGIEAVGRLSDVLREHGYSQIAPLQSEYKDWDEDLKARHGLEAQPAEEHPQFVAADLVCQRIGTRCKEVQPDRAAYQIPGLLLQYRNDLHWGRFDQAMEHMETMAALSLSVVLRECKQMGTALTVEQGVRFLESHILPHQNRSILKNRADEIAMQFQSVLAKNNRQGIRTQAEKKEVASAWLELAISCAKVPVKYEADEIKRRQKEEKTQRETEPVMA